ncbi:hypothetical protein NCCP1664_02030 [Zafaria cholistanensis]|uniref:Transposase IS204/IS1001/IS1096/IS1165 DDE domain-containing protein n=1 Tax=Zafaria cholistanensis TaxID=1682741 RepID=A0A5A7NMI2_9MICC|nr:hypothetical protein NCCP1664_02030 [Zafaria cholistanensis]
MLDAFHVVKLGTQAVNEVRRRGQQPSTGHRGSTGDPLQVILRAGAENLADKQLDRLATAIEANPAHEEVCVAWRCARDLCTTDKAKDTAEGRRRENPRGFTRLPDPKKPRSSAGPSDAGARRSAACFTTGRSSNGGTEAVNGIIELHRRLARGYRNYENCPLRMLLAAGGLTHRP